MTNTKCPEGKITTDKKIQTHDIIVLRWFRCQQDKWQKFGFLATLGKSRF